MICSWKNWLLFSIFTAIFWAADVLIRKHKISSKEKKNENRSYFVFITFCFICSYSLFTAILLHLNEKEQRHARIIERELEWLRDDISVLTADLRNINARLVLLEDNSNNFLVKKNLFKKASPNP